MVVQATHHGNRQSALPRSRGAAQCDCRPQRKKQMKTIMTRNGMQLYQRDRGKRHPAVFSHRPSHRLPTTCLLSLVAIAAMALSINVEPAQAHTVQPVKNIVLVHGAFADGSGWEAVVKILEKDGYKVSVAQPPETSYAEDVKCTKAAIDAMNGPVVLVGHSYGGSIITEAGNDPKVSALVYIAAFALDDGESCATIEKVLPPATTGIKSTNDGYLYIDPAVFAADFAADVPPAKAAFMAESQVLISADSFTSPVKTPAWKSKPTWYMVATSDRSINPDQERMMAKRANAKTIEVKSSHGAYME